MVYGARDNTTGEQVRAGAPPCPRPAPAPPRARTPRPALASLDDAAVRRRPRLGPHAARGRPGADAGPPADPQVALKVMNMKDGMMSMPLDAVKREIENAASLRHQNIVQLIDVFKEGPMRLVMVWELVTGTDLLDLLNACGGRMTEARAAKYLWQILGAVQFLHENGFCHRDLKPENIMVDSATDQIKIIDFGLSKHLDSAVTLGVGTPDYMAPEMLKHGPGRALGKYDAKSIDIWSMGVMVYLMVAGVYPFEDPRHPDNVTVTLQRVRDGRIRPLPGDVSPACTDIIAKMLNKKPNRRITLPQLHTHPWLQTHIAALANSTPNAKETLKHPEVVAKQGTMETKRSATLRRKASSLLKGKASAGSAKVHPLDVAAGSAGAGAKPLDRLDSSRSGRSGKSVPGLGKLFAKLKKVGS